MYHPEPYWNDVAKLISKRGDSNVIAGDDEPYYRYKRQKFLQLIKQIDFKDKVVLEVGSGPGGNLYEIANYKPKVLHGVDISDEMVSISKSLLSKRNISITKIDGEHIPYENNFFDLSFTSTVLQHNTDEQMLIKLIAEICRVTKSDVFIFEKIEATVKGTDLCLGRPVNYYEKIFKQNDFRLVETQFLNIQASYLVSGAIRKLFNKPSRKEGQVITKLSKSLQEITLPITSKLDNIFKAERELAMLHFQKNQFVD